MMVVKVILPFIGMFMLVSDVHRSLERSKLLCSGPVYGRHISSLNIKLYFALQHVC